MTPTKLPRAAPGAIDAYVEAATEPARTRLRQLATVIRAAAPAATERIAYGLPTWHQGENLIHLGAFARHVGVYPGPAAIVAFADELAGYTCSKGAIQLPHDRRLPVALVRKLVRWRVAQATARADAAPTKRAARSARGRTTGVAAVSAARPGSPRTRSRGPSAPRDR